MRKSTAKSGASLSWRYPYENEEWFKQKVSVSEIKHRAMEEVRESLGEDPAESLFPPKIPRLIFRSLCRSGGRTGGRCGERPCTVSWNALILRQFLRRGFQGNENSI